MSIEAYLTQTYDVAALRGATHDGRVTLVQSLADDTSTGELITGHQKVAQRFLLRLLTVRGSLAYRPDEGTNFVRSMYRGLLRTRSAVYSAFAVAEAQIRTQFLRDELPGDADSEKYRAARLVNIELRPGMLNLTVQIRTAATGGLFVLPIPIVV